MACGVQALTLHSSKTMLWSPICWPNCWTLPFAKVRNGVSCFSRGQCPGFPFVTGKSEPVHRLWRVPIHLSTLISTVVPAFSAELAHEGWVCVCHFRKVLTVKGTRTSFALLGHQVWHGRVRSVCTFGNKNVSALCLRKNRGFVCASEQWRGWNGAGLGDRRVELQLRPFV